MGSNIRYRKQKWLFCCFVHIFSYFLNENEGKSMYLWDVFCIYRHNLNSMCCWEERKWNFWEKLVFTFILCVFFFCGEKARHGYQDTNHLIGSSCNAATGFPISLFYVLLWWSSTFGPLSALLSSLEMAYWPGNYAMGLTYLLS